MNNNSCCHEPNKKEARKKSFDYLLWSSLSICLIAMLLTYLPLEVSNQHIQQFSLNLSGLLNKMWWGLALGILAVGFLSQVPREFIAKILGNGKGIKGILRATLAGLLLDLCNHGIVLVGMKLYERGASTAQTIAFLVASPWNSFSLTLILWSLIGLPWTLVFVFASALVAIISGLIFEKLEEKKIIPSNPNKVSIPHDFHFFKEAKSSLKKVNWNLDLFKKILLDSLKDSRMILRWIFFGAVLAAIIQTFVPTHHLETYFGATIGGLFLTLLAATVIEVCSEGSTPIAADLFQRALAPGNAFAFLMTGTATDYTEIMALREQTKSWKIALLLPLITVPQVVLLALLMNMK